MLGIFPIIARLLRPAMVHARLILRVMAHVFCVAQENQIVRVIVITNLIVVMDMLRGIQFPPEELFHDGPVDRLSWQTAPGVVGISVVNPDVPLRERLAFLVRPVALLRAEDASASPLLGRTPLEFLAATPAGDRLLFH